ncbi:response regulator transcription factor [Poseidonocella sp. HB161398]|uniref:response regulator transcription factor n=1 Tax=Poseidonocella sp. HB161398 TaxID=2320855 RepID=UPI001107DFF7|nr:response regulator [Poseidonocella sp. HB161398]
MIDDPDAGPLIYLVDDDETIRTSLSRALDLRGYRVRTFASAQAFLDGYDGTSPGCLLLDYGMPQTNGLQLQKHLRESGIDLPVIFITGHGGVPESVQAMKMGAIDFLEKPFKQSALIDRIETALEIGRERSAAKRARQEFRSRFDSLTEREREIASRMVANPAQSSSKEVGRQLGISPRTVDHHRARIFEKMCVNSMAELLEISLKAATSGDP